MISVQITGHHTFRVWKNGTSTETAVFCNDGNGGWVKTNRSALRSADYIPPDRQILPPPRHQYEPVPRVQPAPPPVVYQPAPQMAPVVMNFDTSGIRDANATPVHHRRQLDLWAEYIATQRSQGIEIRISRQNLEEIKQYANPQEVDRVFRGVIVD